MNVYTRIALISSLSAVTSIGLLTTEAKAFNLTGANVTASVNTPLGGDTFDVGDNVLGQGTVSWQANANGSGTIFLDWIFNHADGAASGTVEYPNQTGFASGSFSQFLTAEGLPVGDYKTEIFAQLRAANVNSITNPGNFLYASDDNVTQWSVVPEPLTMLGSATALGFGAFLKRRQKAAEKKS